MIFCTVGTHEDPFDRLLRALDALPGDEPIQIQSGYSKYVPTRCAAESMMPFPRIQSSMQEARIVITHGGPASIMQALSYGKVPIVVPRQAAFGEHVDDHQVRFASKIADRVLVLLDVAELPNMVAHYDERVAGLGPTAFGPDRARCFALKLDDLTERLLTRS